MKKISVIITTYNRSGLLLRAVNSVLIQTYKNFEIIVMDNCSSDNTFDVIRKIKDKRIRYYRNNVNVGGAENKRLGLEKIEGDYFVFLDDDDYYTCDYLFEDVIKIFKDNVGIKSVVANSNLYDNEINKTIACNVGFEGRISGEEYSKKLDVEYFKPNSTFLLFQDVKNIDNLLKLKMLDDQILFVNAVISGDLCSVNHNAGNYSCKIINGCISFYKVNSLFFDANINAIAYLEKKCYNLKKYKRLFLRSYFSVCTTMCLSPLSSLTEILKCFKIVKRLNSKYVIIVYIYFTVRYMLSKIGIKKIKKPKNICIL